MVENFELFCNRVFEGSYFFFLYSSFGKGHKQPHFMKSKTSEVRNLWACCTGKMTPTLWPRRAKLCRRPLHETRTHNFPNSASNMITRHSCSVLNTRGCLTRTPHGALKGTKARTLWGKIWVSLRILTRPRNFSEKRSKSKRGEGCDCGSSRD